MTDYPIITFGDYGTDWSRAYEFGNALNERFPNQDAGNFAYAIEYNDHPFGSKPWSVVDLEMLQEGERDGGAWIWRVTVIIELATQPFGNETQTWTAESWCDYTGWDCRSALTWNKENA